MLDYHMSNIDSSEITEIHAYCLSNIPTETSSGHRDLRAVASGPEGACVDGGLWPSMGTIASRFAKRFPV